MFQNIDLKWQQIVGYGLGVGAAFVAGWLLFWPYGAEEVQTTIQINGEPAEAMQSQPVSAFTVGDWRLIIGVAGLAITATVLWAVADKIVTKWQKIFALVAAALVGWVVIEWLRAFMTDLDVRQAAWRALFALVALLFGVFLTWRFYRQYNLEDKV